MAEPFETLRVRIDGPIGILELARPERLNAMSRLLLVELADAARGFDEQRDVHVVIVQGQGRAFCAGFDLDDFRTPDPALDGRATGDLGRLMAEAITAMRAVTVAAVQGRCVGGGVVLAAACDLRVATDDAIFSIPEVDLGIPLAWGGIPRLVREIGPALTKELVLTCREFGAAEAHALRFVNRVVPAAELTDATSALAVELAAKSPLTLQVTKRHVNAVAEQMGSTASAGLDATVLAAAMHDPASLAAGRAYLTGRAARRQS